MWISVENPLIFTKQLWVTLLKKCFRYLYIRKKHQPTNSSQPMLVMSNNLIQNLELVLFASRTMVLVALTAIYWAIRSRLERNLCFHSAVCANYSKHFACSSLLGITVCFSYVTAFAATLWFVLESLFSVEFLFSNCENESSSAIFTY